MKYILSELNHTLAIIAESPDDILHKYMLYRFNDYNIEKIDFIPFENHKISVSSYQDLFLGLSTVKEISGLGHLNTGNITNFTRMFAGCCQLEKFDIGMLDVTNAVSMEHMFSDCRNLKHVDLSAWRPANVIYMRNMFSLCKNLETVNLSAFSQDAECFDVFLQCSNLKTVVLDPEHTRFNDTLKTQNRNLPIIYDYEKGIREKADEFPCTAKESVTQDSLEDFEL